MIPHRVPFFIPWLYPSSFLWRVAAESPTLFLTFDDGPVPGATEFVLETLADFNVRGTFFCIGDNVRKHPEIFRRIGGEGHRVGNHTFNHLNAWKVTREMYLENIARCHTEIAATSGERLLFRPPYGRITGAVARRLTGCTVVMWDVLTQDYRASLDSGRCLANSIRATRNGSIVVFHDSYKAERNLRYVLPRYIEHFLANGYAFSTL